jgi:hypothetical protein
MQQPRTTGFHVRGYLILMGREFANVYKVGSRPYGQPAGGNFRDSTPRPQTVGFSRNIQQVNPIGGEPVVPESVKCSSLTRDGVPCKGRPVGDGDLCVFHRE